MKTVAAVIICILLSGCVSEDCYHRCFPDLNFKCDMNPDLPECAARRERLTVASSIMPLKNHQISNFQMGRSSD